LLSALVGAPAAAEDREDDERADGGGEADNEGFVAVDPGFDFVAKVGACAAALLLCVSIISPREPEDIDMGRKLTFEHFPASPQGVPSRKFCCSP
jgi:hypothetical protein